MFTVIAAFFSSSLQMQVKCMCAFVGHLFGIQMLFLWWLKKCRKDDLLYVEVVLGDCMNGFCWYFDVCIMLNQKATWFP